MTLDFSEIRPYTDDEIPAAMNRIASSTSFPLLASYVFPDRNIDDVRREVRSYKSILDFQMGIMYWANRRIIQDSTVSFTCGGMENVKPGQSALYGHKKPEPPLYFGMVDGQRVRVRLHL